MPHWCIIAEFPNYSVSDSGDVRNNKTGKILAGGYDRDGYRQVILCRCGKQFNRRICRLVAQAFIPNPYNLPQVNHKDEVRDHDYVENLEWCSAAYNNHYGNRIARTRRMVLCVETQMIYAGMLVAERYTGILYQYIYKACNNPNRTAGGFHWEYIS